jgi:hypothetical protein
MWQDPIVTEVRQVREAHAAQYNFDLRAIYLDLKKAEQKSEHQKVSFAPKRIGSLKTESKSVG